MTSIFKSRFVRVAFAALAASPLLLGNTSGCGLSLSNVGISEKNGDASSKQSAFPVTLVPVIPSTEENPYRGLPCDVRVGSTNGVLRITQSNVGDGQVLCVKAGTYHDFNVSSIVSNGAKPIVIQNEGLVEITSTMGISNLTNVVFSGAGNNDIENGFLIRDTKYRGTQLAGRFKNFTLQNISYKNVPDYVVSWDRPQVSFNGSADSSSMYNAKFLRLKSENSGQFLILYADREAMKDVILNLEVAYCAISNSPYTGSGMNFAVAFNVDIHHNTFSSVNLGVNEHSGMIFLNGDGKVHHNYLRNYLGNGVRAWPMSLGANGTMGKLDIYNNIFLDTVKYGAIEIQPFADHLGAKGGANVVTTNIRIYNNTAGNLNHGVNLPAGPALWTAGLVDLYNTTGGSVDIQNNVLFNVNNPRDNTYFINGQGYWPPELATMKNNIYYASSAAAGLGDLSQAKPTSNSPLVGKGSALSLVTDDFYGVSRPNPPDLGAVQH